MYKCISGNLFYEKLCLRKILSGIFFAEILETYLGNGLHLEMGIIIIKFFIWIILIEKGSIKKKIIKKTLYLIKKLKTTQHFFKKLTHFLKKIQNISVIKLIRK